MMSPSYKGSSDTLRFKATADPETMDSYNQNAAAMDDTSPDLAGVKFEESSAGEKFVRSPIHTHSDSQADENPNALEPDQKCESKPQAEGACKMKAEPSGGTAAAEKLVPHETSLYFPILSTQWPILYTPEYNIGFLGLEKLHPFDAGKWGKVYAFLKECGMIRDDTTVQPREAQPQDLLVVHTKSYISNLKWSYKVAAITEVPPVAFLPNFIVQKKVLRPFRYHTGGTILAAKIAVERGWAINLGGGFHHCSANRGGGFCAYADITLAIRFLLDRGIINKAMIIDLDAHQGNGHGRDFMNEDRVYIMDVYNRGIYPHDGYAKRGIKRKVELHHYTEDEEYLQKVRTNVEGALNEFTPDLVVYNAGTDVLDGDPLGCLCITPEGIKERDQIVFQKCRTRGIPIMMVTSGGYQRSTARIIADSIRNLHQLRLIECDEAENAPLPEGEGLVAIVTRVVRDALWWWP